MVSRLSHTLEPGRAAPVPSSPLCGDRLLTWPPVRPRRGLYAVQVRVCRPCSLLEGGKARDPVRAGPVSDSLPFARRPAHPGQPTDPVRRHADRYRIFLQDYQGPDDVPGRVRRALAVPRAPQPGQPAPSRSSQATTSAPARLAQPGPVRKTEDRGLT